MSRLRLLAVMLALVGVGVFATPVGASTVTIFSGAQQHAPFTAVVQEDFCGPGVTCGTAVTRYGHADVFTVITSFVPLPSGCVHDEHTSTFTYGDRSTVAFEISGTLCPTSFPNFRFTGTYTVAGGTGRFGGATGSGSVSAFRNNGPIHALYQGTLSPPDES